MSDATNSGQLDLSIPIDGYVFTWNTTGGNWTAQPIQNSNQIQSVPVNNIIFANNSFNGIQAGWIQVPNGGLELDFGTLENLEKTIGCSCKKCKEFNEWAQPNQSDKSFICWACAHGY